MTIVFVPGFSRASRRMICRESASPLRGDGAGVDDADVGRFGLGGFAESVLFERLFDELRLVLVDLAPQRDESDGSVSEEHGGGGAEDLRLKAEGRGGEGDRRAAGRGGVLRTFSAASGQPGPCSGSQCRVLSSRLAVIWMTRPCGGAAMASPATSRRASGEMRTGRIRGRGPFRKIRANAPITKPAAAQDGQSEEDIRH